MPILPRFLLVGLAILAMATTSCVGPGGLFEGSDEARNTSCSSFGFHDPAPSIIPTAGPAIYGVGGSFEYVACFGGDLKDPKGVAAIRWSSLDPRIATVSPPTGGRTTVRGVSVGRTVVRAVIKGSTVEGAVIVCQSASSCPP